MEYSEKSRHWHVTMEKERKGERKRKHRNEKRNTKQ
jgi:hypothetical protein